MLAVEPFFQCCTGLVPRLRRPPSLAWGPFLHLQAGSWAAPLLRGPVPALASAPSVADPPASLLQEPWVDVEPSPAIWEDRAGRR